MMCNKYFFICIIRPFLLHLAPGRLALFSYLCSVLTKSNY